MPALTRAPLHLLALLAAGPALTADDHARMKSFSPRWAKVSACVRFAFSNPRDRIVAVINRPSNWVFAVE